VGRVAVIEKKPRAIDGGNGRSPLNRQPPAPQWRHPAEPRQKKLAAFAPTLA